MSQENVEIVRRASTAFNRGDGVGAFADYASDVVWHDPNHGPDAPEHVHGLSALQAVWDQWAHDFADFTMDIEDFRDIGEFVVAVTRWRATGKGSGVAVNRHAADIYEFRGGTIVTVTLGYPPDLRAALKAVGLDE